MSGRASDIKMVGMMEVGTLVARMGCVCLYCFDAVDWAAGRASGP